jgi:hypothetical protein
MYVAFNQIRNASKLKLKARALSMLSVTKRCYFAFIYDNHSILHFDYFTSGIREIRQVEVAYLTSSCSIPRDPGVQDDARFPMVIFEGMAPENMIR